MKKETYRIISDISEESTGEISVAYTPETGAAMFSKIYPIFHEKYPNILFRIREERVKKMEQLVLKNEVHFAFMTYVEGFKNPDLEYMDMDSEYMVLGLPVTHRWRTWPERTAMKNRLLLDLNLLQNEPFIM